MAAFCGFRVGFFYVVVCLLLRTALERLCGLLGLRGHFADIKDPGGCSASRARELPASGLRRSSWRSDLAAGAEDLEGCSTPRRPSFRLLGFGDLPGALIELPTSKIWEGLQRIQGRRVACSWAPEIRLVLWCGRRRGSGRACSASRTGELSAPGLRRSAWCSDRAADVEDPGGPAAHLGRRAACFRAPEILLAR